MHDPIDEIIENEGGYVNHKDDRGGATNFGITRAVYSEYLGHEASIDEVKNMTEAEAREIYENRYLVGPRIDWFEEPLRTHVLDIAVNSGPATAIRMVQKLVNMAGFYEDEPIAEDGIMGPTTLECVNNAVNAMGNYFNNALVEERIKFYDAIVERRPSQAVFINGWHNRANSFLLPVD